jgi:hypothetical protein
MKDSPAIQSLLAMIGVENEEPLLKHTDRGTALGVVNLKIWTALDNYSNEEWDMETELKSIASEAQSEVEDLLAGRIVTALALTSSVRRAAEIEAKMDAAVREIRQLVAIRNLLVPVTEAGRSHADE